jgi:hypothetical protein
MNKISEVVVNIIEVAIGIIAFFLIFAFLIPLLSGVIKWVATIALILIAIMWLLRLTNIINFN